MDKTDIAMIKDSDGIYDWEIGDDGDFVGDYGFNSLILNQILTDKRADIGEVKDVKFSRGWIGNETPQKAGYEVGSKLWQEGKARKTIRTKNAAVDHVRDAANFLVPDLIDSVNVTGKLHPSNISILITPVKKSEQYDNVLLNLWSETGE
jgi:phage gp46-like protein